MDKAENERENDRREAQKENKILGKSVKEQNVIQFWFVTEIGKVTVNK